jgi:hypothetical protein
MKEYMLIFRNQENQPAQPPSPEQMQAMLSQWQSWIKGIAAQGNFRGTNRLAGEGKTLQSDQVISDGAYAESKEVVGGYLVVQAGSLGEAVQIARGCPIFHYGGTVEVRTVLSIDYDVHSKTFLAGLQ